jgi:hypothetical protein
MRGGDKFCRPNGPNSPLVCCDNAGKQKACDIKTGEADLLMQTSLNKMARMASQSKKRQEEKTAEYAARNAAKSQKSNNTYRSSINSSIFNKKVGQVNPLAPSPFGK